MNGAYKRNVEILLQKRAGEVCAAAVAVDNIVSVLADLIAGLFQALGKAAGKHRYGDTEPPCVLGEIALHVADEIGVHLLVKVFKQR